MPAEWHVHLARRWWGVYRWKWETCRWRWDIWPAVDMTKAPWAMTQQVVAHGWARTRADAEHQAQEAHDANPR